METTTLVISVVHWTDQSWQQIDQWKSLWRTWSCKPWSMTNFSEAIIAAADPSEVGQHCNKKNETTAINKVKSNYINFMLKGVLASIA